MQFSFVMTIERASSLSMLSFKLSFQADNDQQAVVSSAACASRRSLSRSSSPSHQSQLLQVDPLDRRFTISSTLRAQGMSMNATDASRDVEVASNPLMWNPPGRPEPREWLVRDGGALSEQRLSALGNAVVPLQACMAARILFQKLTLRGASRKKRGIHSALLIDPLMSAVVVAVPFPIALATTYWLSPLPHTRCLCM